MIRAMLGVSLALASAGCAVMEASHVQPPISELIAKAREGDAEAHTAVATRYFYGLGVRSDFLQAFRWYRKGADRGSPESMYQLGNFHLYGSSFGPPTQPRGEPYRYSIGQHPPPREHSLWVAYSRHDGVPRDVRKAFGLFKKAAGLGHPLATLRVAQMFEAGLGTPASYDEAQMWYQLASDRGVILAQEWLKLQRP